MKSHETFPVILSTEATPWIFNYLGNMENHWEQKLGESLPEVPAAFSRAFSRVVGNLDSDAC